MKKLINFQESNFNREKQRILNSRDYLNTAIAAWETMGVGPVDADTYADFLTDAIYKRLEGAVTQSLDAANITLRSIREAALSNARAEFESAVLPSLQQVDRGVLPWLTFDKGAAVFSKKSETALRERYSNYIESEEADAVYTELQTLESAINRLVAASHSLSPIEALSTFFYTDQQGVIHVKEEVNYNALAQAFSLKTVTS